MADMTGANQIMGAFFPQITSMRQQGMSTEDIMKAIGQPNDMAYAMGAPTQGMQPPMQQPLVGPAGTNGPSGPTGQPGTNATGFQGFPNFNVPFPYLNLPQQLQASMQTPRNQSYGRFGTGTNPGVGSLPQLPQLPSQAQVPFQPPTGLPQLPQPPGSVSAGNLPTQGAATGFPGLGMPSTSGGGYEAMKSGMLGQIADMQRARQQASTAQQPSLQQFASTFNSLPTDAEKFVYWNSQPQKGMYDPFVNSLPDFRSWVNNMFNNYNGGSLAGAKWDPILGQIRT